MKTKDSYSTNYRVAIHWLNNHYILCNDIPRIDPEIWGELTYKKKDEDEDEDEDELPEIFQWYLSDCSESEVEFLQEHFPDLIFSYSPMLDLFVLCVDHLGTIWDYVPTTTNLPEAKRELGEPKNR